MILLTANYWLGLATPFVVCLVVAIVQEARQTIEDRKRHLGTSWRWECPTCHSSPASKTWPWYFNGRTARWFAQRQTWRDHEHYRANLDD